MNNRVAVVLAAAMAVLVAGVAYLLFQPQPTPFPELAASPQKVAPVSLPAQADAPKLTKLEPAAKLAAPTSKAPGPPESPAVSAEQFVTVQGTVTDVETKEPVAGATIRIDYRWSGVVDGEVDAPEPSHLVEGKKTQVSSDNAGAYSLQVPVSNEANVRLICEAPQYARSMHSVTEAESEAFAHFDFLLEPGGDLKGTVRNAVTGAAIMGVAVQATSMENFDPMAGMRNRPSEDKVTTDEDGTFLLDHLKPGTYRVMVFSRQLGYLPPRKAPTATVDLKKTAPPLEFLLEPGGVIFGTVTNSEGKPVESASLSARVDNFISRGEDGMPSAPATTTTDEHGQYELTGVELDTPVQLHVNGPELAQQVKNDLKLTVASPELQQDIVMSAGSHVSGTAYYEDGTPAVGVSLRLQVESEDDTAKDRSAPGAWAETKEDGKFVMEHVAAGTYRLRQNGGMVFGQTEPGPPMDIDGVTPVSGLKFTVVGGAEDGAGTIAGIVLDQQGKPAANVQVEASHPMQPWTRKQETTGEDGRFEIKALAPAEYTLLANDDRGMASVEGISVGDEVTLRLADPTLIRGIVVNADGQPVAHCRVTLGLPPLDDAAPADMQAMLAMSMNRSKLENATTDGAGSFEFKATKPGSYRARARASGKGTGASKTFTLAPGKPVDLRITLTEGARLAGMVRDTQGNAIQGAEILLRQRLNPMMTSMETIQPAGSLPEDMLTSSGVDGIFEFTAVPPSTYTVMGSHENYAKAVERDLVLEDARNIDDFVLTLSQGGCVNGVPLLNGVSKPGLTVQLMGDSAIKTATVDDAGRFEICQVPAGTYMLMVMDMQAMQQGGMPTQRQVRVVDGETVTVEFGAAAGAVPVTGVINGPRGTVTTVVLLREGAPSLGDIALGDMSAQMEYLEFVAGQSMAKPDGTFAMEEVAPGTYTLQVHSITFDPLNPDIAAMQEAQGKPAITQQVEVRENEPLELELEIPEP